MEKASSLSCPSFWKLLMDEDFNRGIRIPHSFSNELEGRKSPCNYSLITENKKRSSDRSWRAKLVKKDHHFCLCKKSWPEFVRDHSLKYGDLLLFHLIDKKTFWITPYGANGSKKRFDDDNSSSDDDEDSDTSESESDEEDDDDDDDFRDSAKHHQERKHKLNKRGGSTPAKKSSSDKDYNTGESDSDEDGDDERGGASRRSGRGRGHKVREIDAKSRKEIEEMVSAKEASKWDHCYDLGAEKPYFIRTIKSQNMYWVVVPKSFAKETNLIKADEVMLRCEDGDYKKLWSAKIIVREVGRVDIAEGWSEFRREYNIQAGDTCRFTISNHRGTTTISVHVFRSDDHRSRK